MHMVEKDVVEKTSGAAQGKRYYQMLESHTEGQKQNVLTLTDKPNGQVEDTHVYWTLKLEQNN